MASTRCAAHFISPEILLTAATCVSKITLTANGTILEIFGSEDQFRIAVVGVLNQPATTITSEVQRGKCTQHSLFLSS